MARPIASSVRLPPISRRGSPRRAVVGLALLLAGCGAGCTSSGSSGGLDAARPPAGLVIEAVLGAKIDAQIAEIETRPADADAHGVLGMIYEANEVWEPAVRAYRNAATLDPDRPDWLFHSALCLVKTGNSTDAQELFADLARRFPQFAPGRHFFGLTLLDDGDLDGADRELSAAHRLKSSLSETNAALAQLRNVQGRFDEALPLAEKAVQLDGRSPRARFVRGQALRGLGRLDDAKGDLAAGSGASPGRLPSRLDAQIPQYAVGVSVQVDKGADLIDAGRFDDAIRILRAALAERPDHAALLTNLAVAYTNKGDHAAAREILEKLLLASPDDLPVLLNLSEALWATRDHDRGLEIASHAVDRHPQSGLAHYARGRVLYSSNRVTEGIAECVKAGELEPLNAEIQSAIAEGYFVSNQLELAERYFRRSIDLDSRRLAPRTNLCAVLLRLGKLDEAAALISELQQLAPDHPKVRALTERLANPSSLPPPGNPR